MSGPPNSAHLVLGDVNYGVLTIAVRKLLSVKLLSIAEFVEAYNTISCGYFAEGDRSYLRCDMPPMSEEAVNHHVL